MHFYYHISTSGTQLTIGMFIAVVQASDLGHGTSLHVLQLTAADIGLTDTR